MNEQVATLIRVSSDGQDEKNQVADVAAHVASHSYTVARTFTLHDVSASKGEQEATLAEIMADIQAGNYSVVVIAHSSRIDRRDPRIQRLYTDSVSLAGGRIESAREPEFGKNTLGGDIMTVVSQWSNFKYSRDLGEHVQAAFDRIDANGAIRGKALYGFAIDGEKYAKSFVIVDDEASVIRDAVSWYLEGSSLAMVCRKLNEAKRLPRSGVKWTPKTLGQVMRSETLIGRRHQGNAMVRVPSIISVTDFNAVQAKLDAKAYRKGVRTHGNTALLTSIIHCGQCGRAMYRVMGGYGASRQANYYCRPIDGKSCKTMIPVVTADLWNANMISTIRHLTFTKEVVIKGHNYQDEIDHLALDIKGLDVTADDFIELATSMKAEMKRLASLPNEPDRIEERQVSFDELHMVWGTLDDAKRREIMLQVGIKVYAFKVEGAIKLVAGMDIERARKTLAA